MHELNPVFAELPVTIFTVMSRLATEHGAINLGQGFPDSEGPEAIRRAAADALLAGPNQYPPSMGMPDLRRAVAEHNLRFHELEVDPETEVIVTSGATEALADCLLALLRPGDEAIVFEPAYDSYAPIIRAAGATPRFVPLRPPDWRIDTELLQGAFNEQTRVVIVNSPMNPTGKVFSELELSQIAELMCEHDVIAVCDEVYEHLVFDGRSHVPLMSLPGMRERCVRIGSAGKTFSLTGWKIGYISADRALAEVIAKAHQFITFTSVPALQTAVAQGLRSPASYFTGLARDMERRRDLLVEGLEDVGFAPLPCHGTYFVTADFRGLDAHADDAAFCRRLTVEAGVAAIPVSAFYQPAGPAVPHHLVRFCFCKETALLEEALRRIRAWFR